MRDFDCELRHSVSHCQFPPESPHLQRTKSSYNPQNHYLEDWQRDVPQALLFPHSLDTAAPGRQVLLRHQRVILAAPTPAPSMTGTGEGDIAYENQGGMMRMKIERMKRWWAGLKQRTSPKLFPQAWVLFLVIILIATGAIVTGWGGLAAETVHHQALARPVDDLSTISTARPAPPNLEAGASTVTSSGLTWHDAATGYGSAMTGDVTAWSPRSTMKVTGHPVTRPHATSTSSHAVITRAPADEHVVKMDIVTDYEITHVTSIVTDWIIIYVTATTVETTTPPVSGPDSSEASDVPTSFVTEVVYTSEHHQFCPDPNRPAVWTPCAPDHAATDAPGAAIPTRATASPACGRCSLNPFRILKGMVQTIWKSLWDTDPTSVLAHRWVHRWKILELDGRCEELQRLMLAMADILEAQRYLLDDKDEAIAHLKQMLEDQRLLMRDQEDMLRWSRDGLRDAVAFIVSVKNDAVDALRENDEVEEAEEEVEVDTTGS
ncbi:hypothetical protein F5B19DRAFT_341141 [Rostrohypoxylon terebratum]|nr:hypothetical protein F5B19DRAFT_341141 [Rostrohypoxylon terebratum]